MTILSYYGNHPNLTLLDLGGFGGVTVTETPGVEE